MKSKAKECENFAREDILQFQRVVIGCMICILKDWYIVIMKMHRFCGLNSFLCQQTSF